MKIRRTTIMTIAFIALIFILSNLATFIAKKKALKENTELVEQRIENINLKINDYGI